MIGPEREERKPAMYRASAAQVISTDRTIARRPSVAVLASASITTIDAIDRAPQVHQPRVLVEPQGQSRRAVPHELGHDADVRLGRREVRAERLAQALAADDPAAVVSVQGEGAGAPPGRRDPAPPLARRQEGGGPEARGRRCGIRRGTATVLLPGPQDHASPPIPSIHSLCLFVISEAAVAD